MSVLNLTKLDGTPFDGKLLMPEHGMAPIFV
jgi:hypothetical protein